jgi:hypothetical protein
MCLCIDEARLFAICVINVVVHRGLPTASLVELGRQHAYLK